VDQCHSATRKRLAESSKMDTHQTGGLHTGNVAPATTTDKPGMMHHTGAPAAKRGGMFGGRKHDESAVAAGGHGGKFKLNAGAKTGLLIAELLTLLAFIVTLGGLSAMQKQANKISGALPAATQLVYNDQFQSAGQTPYPNDGDKQFGLQWWILMFELFIFLTITFLLIAMPRQLLRLKHVALAFLVYVFVLATLQVNSLFWFNRSAIARSVYGSSRIRATLAGALLACICNAFSIIFLGLLRDARDDHLHGHGSKRVGHDATGSDAV
jgi:hypothetical protein